MGRMKAALRWPSIGLSVPLMRWLSSNDRCAAPLAAVALCAVLGILSLLVPPAMYSDSGWGFLTWRGTLMGAPNFTIAPDPDNITHDSYYFNSTWSPGQYLVPGVISLTGISLGTAIALTATLSLLACLIGWLMVLRQFSPGSIALLLVLFIGTFRFSTLPFGIYDGGEILLQGATPWIIIYSYRIPRLDAVSAALASAGILLLAFFAKLSGLIVAGSALIAGGILVLAHTRRITVGMLGGGLGALSAMGLVYVFFISRGWNAADQWDWSLPAAKILFAIAVPWVAGTSWTDLLAWLFLHPQRQVLDNPEALVWFALPIAIFLATLTIYWRPRTDLQFEFTRFSVLFYAVTALAFVFLWVHGAAISVEERHFREVGISLFVCCYIRAIDGIIPSWTRTLFFVFCGCMSLYGIVSFSNRAWAAADGHSLDGVSRTNQPIIDRTAIEFLRDAYTRETRRAVFVLPSPDIGVTLPLGARIIAVHLDFEPEAKIAGLHYGGRAAGHVYVLMQNAIADSGKGKALLAAFSSYPTDGWERKTFGWSSIFIQ
jgi:hypothetical protein